MDLRLNSKEKCQIVYLLPCPSFFSQTGGVGGHIAHLVGILGAFNAAGFSCDLIAEEDCKDLVSLVEKKFVCPKHRILFFGYVSWANKISRIAERVVIQNKIRLIYARFATRFSIWFYKLKRRLPQTVIVLEVNSMASFNNKFMITFEKPALSAADVIVCVSEVVKDKIVRLFGRKFIEKMIVIPNGVDIKRFPLKKKKTNGQKDKELKIAYCGVLKPGKYGLDNLVKAFSMAKGQNSNISLHFYGEGPYRRELEKKTRGMEKVFFHGPKPLEIMPSILGQMGVLVCTLYHRYTSPIKVYEYMCSGVPIIAAAIPQVVTALDKGVCGLLYEGNRADQLADHILTISKNPELGRRLAVAARQQVEKLHTWDSRLTSLLNFLVDKGFFYEKTL